MATIRPRKASAKSSLAYNVIKMFSISKVLEKIWGLREVLHFTKDFSIFSSYTNIMNVVNIHG